MTIIEAIDIKNFQRVSAVKIEPTDRVIMLFGKNAQGKTSVLDAIEATLEKFNGRVMKRPVKDNTSRADIQITLSDGSKLHQKFLPSGPSLTGVGPDGQKITQRDLDQSLSAMGTDACGFIGLPPKEQVDILLSVSEIDIDPIALDAEYAEVEESRKLIGRQARAIGDVTIDETLPVTEVAVSELVAQIQAGQEQNVKAARATALVGQSEERLESAGNKVDQLKNALREAEAELLNAESELVEARKYDAAMKPLIVDLAPLQVQLESAEETNARIRANNTAMEQAAAKEALEYGYRSHTARLEGIKKTKIDGLAKAKMPIPGLSFDEFGVLYNDVQFSRASNAETRIISFAMLIAMDPKIRTAVMRDGNALDAKSLETIRTMCEENNFQLFIEFVSDETDHEYLIVDGHLEGTAV